MINNLQVGDTIYKKSVSKDVVLMAMYKNRQLSKGDKLPRYAKVDLVIGAGLEKNVNAPSFLNLSLNAAKQLIKQHYFELGNIEYERPSDSLLAASGDPRVRVVYQDPPPGSLTDEGVPVSLWLSSKPKEELTTYIESLDAIYNQHMEVDTIEVYKSSPSTVTEIIPQTQPQTYTVPRQNKPRPVNPRPNEGGGSSAPPSTGQESSGQGVEPQVPAPPPAAPVPLPSGGEGVEMD
ncbi:MAG: hypothetical protein C4K58_08230 [Flavobacteriaceae bacterium]|nr:MAG: hypothetical protein C4K58_08230 [Flavobacteriaceae bacterium]